ncbi:hypothetical protein Gotur_019586, partial [Gossypium turneri]
MRRMIVINNFLLNYHFICRLCLKLKILEHRALILKRSWTNIHEGSCN